MASAPRIRHGRRGLTLVELLMVIVVITILMAVAIPLVRPAFQDRYMREAARQVDSYLYGAATRALEIGRPVGVWIERLNSTELGSRSAVRLYIADTPPAFTGTVLGARVSVLPTGVLQFKEVSDEAILRTITAPGERFTIKFDYQGHDYPGLCTPAHSFEIEIPLGVPPGAEAAGPGVPYEITLSPTRSAVAPLQLPADSVIDLSLSGMGPGGREFDSGGVPPFNTAPVVIMFAPSGRVDHVYLGGQPIRPFAPIHLLIGRRGRVVNPLTTDVSDPQRANLADPTCLWVTISERTGAIVTADNRDTSYIAPATLPPPYDPTVRLRAARGLARSSAQKGGR